MPRRRPQGTLYSLPPISALNLLSISFHTSLSFACLQISIVDLYVYLIVSVHPLGLSSRAGEVSVLQEVHRDKHLTSA